MVLLVVDPSISLSSLSLLTSLVRSTLHQYCTVPNWKMELSKINKALQSYQIKIFADIFRSHLGASNADL